MDKIFRHEDEVLEFYRTASSAIVTDSLSRLGLGSWMDDVRPLNIAWHVSGRVRTLKYGPKTGVNHTKYNIYSWCEELSPGDVLVIDTGSTRGWLMGENIAHFCLNQGLAGVVTDGRVRDLEELLTMPLSIFSRGTSARPSRSEVGVVAVDVPVTCAGAYLRPGDLLVGDFDGVVTVPSEVASPLIGEVEDMRLLEKEQEFAIRDRAPLTSIDHINKRKKILKNPDLFKGL